jgi:outer membrane immunogenic protein
MKKIFLAASALVACAGVANAADIAARPYTKAPPMTAPAAVYNWTGFYIGGHIGGAFGGDNALFGDNSRFMGGVQGGADYQFAPNWVVGIEAQYSWLANANRNGFLPNGVLVTDRERGLGSVTGRLGYTWGPTMIYAKGGYAFRDNSLGASFAGAPVAFASTGNRDSGYTVGAGLEYMFAPNWSAKAEYQYYNFGRTTLTTATIPPVTANYRNDEHTVKVGLNYRFGWGGPAVARY